MNLKTFSAIFLTAFFVFACFAYFYGEILIGKLKFVDLVYLVASFFPLFACLFTYRLYGWQSIYGKVIAILGLAMLGRFVGELIWVVFTYFDMDPFPSVADLFFILFYPLTFLALFMELRSAKTSSKSFSLFINFILLLFLPVFVALVMYFGVYLAYDPAAGLFENVVAMSYGLGDLVLVLLSVFLLRVLSEYWGGKMFFSWLYFMIGLMSMLVADVGFAIFTNEYEVGEFLYVEVIDLAWIVSFLFMTYGVILFADILRQVRSRLQE